MPTAVSVYPNPFDRRIEIELTCGENRDCIILLANMEDKRIIRMLGAGLEKGVNKIPLDDLQSLQLGSYQLDIKDPSGDTIYNRLLIKQ